MVRGDRLAILPEHGANDDAGKGREIPLAGPTHVAREDISDALDKHIQAWGMAGEGLYWRPVIELNVAADGQESRRTIWPACSRTAASSSKTAAVAQNSEGEASVRVAEEELPEMPGQDAFLDVLTNMVGIIILLVVVMGLRSSRAATASLGEDHAAIAAAAARAAAENELRDAHRDMLRSRHEMQQAMERAVSRSPRNVAAPEERQYLTTYVAAFGQELNDRRTTLTTEEQRDFDLRRQLVEAQTSLEDLSREQVTLLSQPAEAEVLENRPTPITKQLSEKELFLQLVGDHVAVIPLCGPD